MTTTLTATPQPGNHPPRVLLELQYDEQAAATITRVDPDGTTRTVRLAEPATLISGAWTGYDYESWFGAPTVYTATTADGSVSSAAVVLDVADTWLRHPGIPSLSMPIDYQGDPQPVRPVNQAVLEPLGRRTPIVVSDGRRKAKRGSAMTIRTKTLDEAQALLGLVDDVSVLLLDVPPSKGYGVTHEYRALGDLTEGRHREDFYPWPWRIWTCPFTVVDRPAGGLQAQRTWASVLDEAATWAELGGMYATWTDVLTGTRTVTGSAGTTAYDAEVLADSPALYLTLDGTAGGYLDKSGNGRNGTPHGGPSAATFLSGGAVRFDGVDDYVEVPDSAALSPAGGAMTVEIWARVRALVLTSTQPSSGGDYGHWLGKMGLTSADNTHAEWTFRFYTQTPTIAPERGNQFSFYSFNPAATPDNPRHLGAGSYFRDQTGATAIIVDTWMHIVGVVDTVAGVTKIYRDGALRDTDLLSGYNITPTHTSAPLRIGTADLGSFAAMDMARLAIYPYELPRERIVAHLRTLVPAPAGTARFIRTTGTAATRATGTRLQLTVGPSGVPAGATLLANATTAYTSSGPAMFDSRGNTWTRERTGVDGANTIRLSAFRCQVQVALRPGDRIELRAPVSVGAMALTVDEYADVAFTAIHASNATSGTSAAPGGAMFVDTSTDDTLVRGDLAIAGPTADSYAADSLYDMVERSTAGTNVGDGADVVAHAASKNAVASGSQRWRPTLGTARTWVQSICTYLTGTPTVTPPTQGTATRVATVGSGTSTSSGTTLVITVGGSDGVPAGHTLFAAVSADYTAAGATMTDSRGNTWTRDRTSASTGNANRGALFSCPVTTALQPGDTITVTWATSITRKAATILQYAQIMAPTTIDVQSGTAGASGQPSTSVTTTVTNTLLVAAVAMAGPASGAYTPDIGFVPETVAGTTGSGSADRTVYAATKAVYATGAQTFAPLIDGSYPYATAVVAYRAA